MKSTAETRTSVQQNHALIAPDGWVSSVLPGWTHCSIHVLISAAMGARFSQLMIIMEKDGLGAGNTGTSELFLYTMEGEGTIEVDGSSMDLSRGHFVYVPPGTSYRVDCSNALRMTVFQKEYQPLRGREIPGLVKGDARKVPSAEYMDDPQLHMQHLLPDGLGFDMAVNIFTYQPGGNLPFVETHIMEHGLIYLQGQGVYRLGDRWYPVMKDDCIWMAPYCPQWFVAMGKEPAIYLYYKDVNRPLW